LTGSGKSNTIKTYLLVFVRIFMQQTTLTSKGQITIPKWVRDSLALQAGDKVEFVLTKNNEVLLKPVTKTVDEVFGCLFKAGRPVVDIDEMDSLLKQKVRADFR
jgi:AbrB family looped-hinge helix DNA binding protein